MVMVVMMMMMMMKRRSEDVEAEEGIGERRMMTSGEEEGSDGQKRAEAQWDVIDMISLRRSNLRESLSL